MTSYKVNAGIETFVRDFFPSCQTEIFVCELARKSLPKFVAHKSLANSLFGEILNPDVMMHSSKFLTV
jgi:hypothetical protein